MKLFKENTINMQMRPFQIERYFAQYEFSTKYIMGASDCDGYSLEYILNNADEIEIDAWKKMHLGYTDSQGSLFLRNAIAQQYKSVEAKNVVVMSPGEANFIFSNIFLKQGDQVICIHPSYQSLYEIPISLGCEVIFWKPSSTFPWTYSVEDLQALLTPKTKLLIINFPHNPTGFIPTKSEILKIKELAAENNIVIYSDEMYFDIIYEKDDILPSIADIYPKGIVVSGMSKSFGLAGLRIGWIITKDEQLLQKILSFKDFLSICNNTPSEILSFIALNHKEKFINPNIKKIVSNIFVFEKFLQKYANIFSFSKMKAGSTAFVELKIDKTSLEFCEKLVKETSIMLLPSEVFDYGSKHIRVGFGRSNFPDGLALFDQWLSFQNKHF